MGFTRIKEEDHIGKGVTGLPDIPGLEPEDMQKKFDELGRDVAIPAINRLADELEMETAAGNLGIEDDFEDFPNEGKKLKSLLKAMANSLKNTKADSHKHENKTVLDMITETMLSALSSVSNILTGILSTTKTISEDDTALPTAGAVSRYVQKMGGGDMLTSVYDKDADGIVDEATYSASSGNSSKFGGQLPDYYVPKSNILETLEEISANTDSSMIVGAEAVDALNKNMGNCTFSVQSDGAYVTYVPTGGADPVSKKLGSGNYTITFTLEIDLLSGLNQTISKREETYHMYVNEGNVTTDFEEIGTYRSTAGQGWTYVRLVSISISDN